MSSTDGSLEVKIAYLEVLQRQPTVDELNAYKSLILNGSLTITTLEDQLKLTNEYLIANGLFSGDTTYVSPTLYGSNLVDSTDFSGLTLANGKLALITSAKYNDMAHSYISTNFDFNTMGSYTQNVVETYKYTNFNLFDRDQTLVSVSDIKQSLNMETANFTNSYIVSSNNINVSTSNNIRVIRQLPFCVLNTIEFKSDTTAVVDLYHDLIIPDNIDTTRYNNNLINTVINGSNNSLYFFQATGNIKDYDKSISTCSAYIFENSNNVSNKGYNILMDEKFSAYNKFSLSLVANETHKIHILSSTMTQFDFDKPDLETQRILINALTNSPDTIIEDHVSEWSKLWVSNIYITPKTGITTTETDEINTMNRFLKFSLYNIYSIIRDDINTDLNAMNLTMLDFNGNVFWNAELFLLPVLSFLKPKAAKTLLDFRYVQLEKAIKLAASQGMKGAKYAYENDSLEYKNLYWNTISPLQIFNTALISIAIWCYYRITRDINWMAKRAYEILKNNADFFVSNLIAVYVKDIDGNDTTIVDYYSINNVVGMDNTASNNNTLTNYLAKLTLSFALQAKYELNYVYAVSWGNYIDKIKINVEPDYGNTLYNIIKTNDDDSPTTLKLLETLLILHPYYSKEFYNLNTNYDYATLRDNITAHEARLDIDSINNPFNTLILSTLNGSLAQLVGLYADKVSAITKFDDKLQSFIENCTIQPWGNFLNVRNNSSYNDINMNSMFLLNFMTSIIGLQIKGSITESRFYSEEMGVSTKTSSVLPPHWKNIAITGIGVSNDLSYTITNSIPYT